MMRIKIPFGKLTVEQLEVLSELAEAVIEGDGRLADEDGQLSDWIEVYNPGPDTVDLDGWRLTDDPRQISQLPESDDHLEGGPDNDHPLCGSNGDNLIIGGDNQRTYFFVLH